MHLWQSLIANAKLNTLCGAKGAYDAEQRRRLVTSDPEAAFYSGKMQSAKFFIFRVLPILQGKVKALRDSEFSLNEVDEACFG
jgi:hypothetical protein